MEIDPVGLHDELTREELDRLLSDIGEPTEVELTRIIDARTAEFREVRKRKYRIEDGRLVRAEPQKLLPKEPDKHRDRAILDFNNGNLQWAHDRLEVDFTEGVGIDPPRVRPEERHQINNGRLQMSINSHQPYTEYFTHRMGDPERVTHRMPSGYTEITLTVSVDGASKDFQLTNMSPAGMTPVGQPGHDLRSLLQHLQDIVGPIANRGDSPRAIMALIPLAIQGWLHAQARPERERI